MPSNIVGFDGSQCLQWLEGIKTAIWGKLGQAAHLSLQRWKDFVSWGFKAQRIGAQMQWKTFLDTTSRCQGCEDSE